MKNDILRGLINEGHVTVYLDDILIFSDDLFEHQRLVDRVLQRLQEHGLCLKREKCIFERSSVNYLGVIVGDGKVRMDPAKVSTVTEWKTPINKRGVQEFLGFANFYRWFIRDFSKIARPLHELTGKQPWKWGNDQQESFDALKRSLCSEPILAIPKDDAPFRVEADCSQYAMGGFLSQLIDDKWHPVAYRSQSLSPVERSYKIHDRELLAIMRALEDWRLYLLGAMHPFEI